MYFIAFNFLFYFLIYFNNLKKKNYMKCVYIINIIYYQYVYYIIYIIYYTIVNISQLIKIIKKR